MSIGPDRVQVLKQESSALGGNASDATDYPAPINPQQDVIESAGIFLQDAGNRDENCYIERNGNDMRFRDGNNTTPITLTSLLGGGGGGISEAQHENLDTLAHDVAETSYVKVTRVSGQISNVTVWTSSAMTQKIRETAITRTSGQVSQIVETQYDGSGVALAGQVLTHTITRSGGRVDNINTVQT